MTSKEISAARKEAKVQRERTGYIYLRQHEQEDLANTIELLCDEVKRLQKREDRLEKIESFLSDMPWDIDEVMK